MIIDVTGVELNPGNNGRDCFGNGEHFDEQGNPIECCCDECNYMMRCLETHSEDECEICDDIYCPHAKAKSEY